MRLIDEQGKQVGIVETREALRLAQDKGLDLVEISPSAQPPVCKILDFGKFLYQLEKEEQKAKKAQKKIEVKGVRIKIGTQEHDFNLKVNQAKKFLSEGHKVKIDLILRGREKAHKGLAKENLQKFIQNLGQVKLENEISSSPFGLSVIVSSTGEKYVKNQKSRG